MVYVEITILVLLVCLCVYLLYLYWYCRDEIKRSSDAIFDLRHTCIGMRDAYAFDLEAGRRQRNLIVENVNLLLDYFNLKVEIIDQVPQHKILTTNKEETKDGKRTGNKTHK